VSQDAVNRPEAASAAQAPPLIHVPGDMVYEAFVKHEAQIRAIPAQHIIPLRMDAMDAIKVSVGARKRYIALRPQMVALGPQVKLNLIDDCLSITYAFAYARSLLAEQREPGDTMPILREKGIKVRHLLDTCREVLDTHEIAPSSYVFSLSSGSGYMDLFRDLIALVRFYRENWDKVAGKVAVTVDDLKEAVRIAHALLHGVAERDGAAPGISGDILFYQQAGTLFQLAYKEVFDVTHFIRRAEGDGELYTPTLYVNRTGPRGSDEEEPEPTAPGVPTPPATPAAPGAPAVPVTHAAVSSAEPASVPVGHMGSNPFIS
jgi:hypothetical protein